MHNFSELVESSIAFSLNALNAAQKNAIDGLQISAATSLVKTLQMVQLQKAISAVGMFSMFDAILQEQLQCPDGFKAAGELLEAQDEKALNQRFSDLRLAINVLKHGRGRSYDMLVKKSVSLEFQVRQPDEAFFNEGDVAEISTLVEVDDQFLLLCAEVIHGVASIVNTAGQHST